MLKTPKTGNAEDAQNAQPVQENHHLIPQQCAGKNEHSLIREYDKWLVFGVSLTLGLTIGLGETKAHWVTGFKEYGLVAGIIGVMACTLAGYYSIRNRYKKLTPAERSNRNYLLKGLGFAALGLTVGYLPGMAIVQMNQYWQFAIAAGSVALISGIGLLLSYGRLQKAKNQNQNQTALVKKRKNQFRLSLLAFTGSVFMLGLGAAIFYSWPGDHAVFDQAHSYAISKWMRRGWLGAKSPLTFQNWSYEWGYRLVAGLVAVLVATALYRTIYKITKKSENTCATVGKWMGSIIPGFILALCVYGSNLVIHSRVAGLAGSVRPIVGTQWQDLHLVAANWFEKLNALCGLPGGGISNPGSDLDTQTQNWYSGHTSWVATAFWLAVFLTIYYERTVKSEDKTLKRRLFHGALLLGLFTMTFVTAALRVGGLAHTVSAVVSGSIIPMFTVAIGIGLFVGLRKLAVKDDKNPGSQGSRQDVIQCNSVSNAEQSTRMMQ